MLQTISPEELKSRLDAGEHLNLVDVREPYEHSEFNIGGQLIPLGRVQLMQLDEIEELRNEEVIVYCKSGNRSAQACMMLQMAGFLNVKNLSGGMMQWQNLFGG